MFWHLTYNSHILARTTRDSVEQLDVHEEAADSPASPVYRRLGPRGLHRLLEACGSVRHRVAGCYALLDGLGASGRSGQRRGERCSLILPFPPSFPHERVDDRPSSIYFYHLFLLGFCFASARVREMPCRAYRITTGHGGRRTSYYNYTNNIHAIMIISTRG